MQYYLQPTNYNNTRISICSISGPEDVEIRRFSDGLFHQQSVTLTARMWPPVEAGPPSNTVWGLPTLAWGILIGCTVLAILTLATFFLCCWLLPRSRKFLSPTRRYTSTRTTVSSIPSSIPGTWPQSLSSSFHSAALFDTKTSSPDHLHIKLTLELFLVTRRRRRLP